MPTIRVPTLVIHRTEDVTINVEGGRYLAEHIPGARYIELPGKDHIPFVGDNAVEIADAIPGVFDWFASAGRNRPRARYGSLYRHRWRRLRKLLRSAITAGANSLMIITSPSAAISLDFAAERSRRPATEYSRRSMDRRAAFAARALLRKKFTHSALMFARASIRESVK